MSTPPDVLVLGGGMAGLVTALQAQELGARITLLEKGPAPGGSLALSGGTIWCARTVDDLRRLVPRGDPDLGAALVADFEPGIAWLRGLGATLTPVPVEPYRVCYWTEPNPRAFVAHLLERFTAGGGTVLTETSATGLTLDARGAVSGVTAATPAGPRAFAAKAVILATGGFQNNPAMRAQYFGPWADRLITRGNPHSTGDGYWIATDAGASPSAGMSTFYGHLLPAPPARVPVHDFIAYTMYHSEQSVLVNLRGERFTDESVGDETNSQRVARQPEALAWLIYDDTIYRQFAKRAGGYGARPTDTFYESQALGAPSAVADTLEALCARIGELGGHAAGTLATLREYNAAVAGGAAASLAVPRRAKANPVTTAPFYALAVTPGITFTLGGIRIDPDARVLDRSSRPIPGLFAAGADAGGIHNEQYAGGLCLGLVFGRRAARGAVACAA